MCEKGLMIALAAAAVTYFFMKQQQEGKIGFVNASKEPNFPTTAVAGIGARGWTTYREPIGTRYIERVALTT